MKSTSKHVRTLALTFALVGAGLTAAYADSDVKTYGASNCIDKAGGSGDFTRYTSGVTRWGSDGDGWLLCPVVRDKFSGSGSVGMDMFVKVTVKDTHFTEDIECNLVSRTFDGRQREWVSAKTNFARGEIETLDLFVWNRLNSYNSMICYLPTNDGDSKALIYGYKVTENEH